MRLAFLGPIEAWSGDDRLDLGGPKPRLILSLLAIDLGRVVATDRLIDAVWGDTPPADPRAALQVNISTLRRAAAGTELVLDHRGPGYVLDLDPERVDLHAFAAFVEQGARLVPSEPQRAATLLRDALGYWRGTPFGDLAGEPALGPEVARLEELRLRGLEKRIGADLALGYHDRLVEELPDLLAARPLREVFWGQLALARYRQGKTAEALRCLERARRTLAEELGAEPSASLEDLRARILRQDPGLASQHRRRAGRGDEQPLRMVRGYALYEQVESSGGAVRYRGQQPGTGRPVQIAVIEPDDGDRPTDAVAQRVALARRLEHPSLPEVIDHWRQKEAEYVVTEWIAGKRVSETLRRGPWKPEAAATLIDHVAAAVDHALEHGSWTGRLTSDVITIDADDRPVIAGPTTELLPGGEFPDAVQDRAIRDLGALGFELLTTLRLDDGSHPTGDRRLSRLRPELPAAADRVIDRAVSADASRQFDSAQEFARAFRGAVTGTQPDLFAESIRNPYKGLRAFGEADAGDFFGRAALVQQLWAKLEQDRLVAVVGPSGSGKSSTVRAGLAPALASSDPAEPPWRVATMVPGEWPMAELEQAFEQLAVGSELDVARTLADAEGLQQVAAEVAGDDHRVLVVVDQFEELFVLAREPDRRAFIGALSSVARDPSGSLSVVVTLRADFYDELLLDPELGPFVAQRTMPITPLTPQEVERAITGPADVVGLQVEPELTAALVAEVVDAPGSLPLLQYALTELCEARDGDALTLAAYRRIGGLRGALAGRAEALYGELDDADREVCRQVLLRLVVVTEQVVETRRRVLRPELHDLGPDDVVERVVEDFGAHRLLTFDRDPFTRVPTVEIAHEALTRSWARLRGWIDAARDDLVLHRRLLTSADEWRRAGDDPSYLLRGARLDSADEWASSSSVMLTQTQREYLEESRHQRAERQAAEERRRRREAALEQRSLRRLRGLVAVLAVGVAAAVALSLLALQQRDTAEQQRGVAQQQREAAERQERIATARELAAASIAELGEDPERSVLLAIEAVETTRAPDGTVLPEAESALHRALLATRVEAVHPSGGGVAIAPDGTTALLGMDGSLEVQDAAGDLLWHVEDRASSPLVIDPDGNVPLNFLGRTSDISFDPDGARVATTREDFTVEVQRARDGEVLFRLDRPAVRPVFSPDGRTIAAALVDRDNDVPWGAARVLGLFDAATGELLRRFEGHRTAPLDHAFAPDGSRLASAAPTRGMLRIWDTATGDQVASLERALVKVVAYSPDGSRLALASGDGLVELRDPETLEELQVFRGHDGDLFSVAWSPDGSRVAVAGSGAEVWDPRTGEEVMALVGHDAILADISWTPDGQRILTSAEDDTTRVWDVADPGGRELVNLPGPPPPAVGALAFSPDGELLAAAAPDGIRVYRTGTWEVVRTLPVDPVAVSAVAFGPEGRQLAAGLFTPPPRPGVEAVVAVWDMDTGERVTEFPGHGGVVFGLAFAPGGRRIATGTEDEGVARVFELDGSDAPVSTYRLTEGSVRAVGFTADGLFVGGQSAAYLVDPDTGSELLGFDAVDESILDDALTPDGELITADIGGRVRVWDPESGQLLRELWRGTKGGVSAVGVAEGTVVSATPAGIALTELETGEPRAEFRAGHEGGAFDVGLTPAGRYLATAGRDGKVRLFVLEVDELLALARQRVTRELTTDECQRFLHRESCPAG